MQITEFRIKSTYLIIHVCTSKDKHINLQTHIIENYVQFNSIKDNTIL